MDTGWKSSRNWLQQYGRPQMPMPPIIFASSLTPIWRSSIRLRKMPAKILHQFAEVDPPVGGEEEHRLVPLEIALNVHQLHVKSMLGNFLLAYLEGFLLALFVYLGHAQVIRRGDSHHRTERLHDRSLHDRVISAGAVGNFQALGGLYYDLVPGLDIQLAGIEEVAFSLGF